MTINVAVKPRSPAFCFARLIGSARKSTPVTLRPLLAKKRAFSPVPQPASRIYPVIWLATSRNAFEDDLRTRLRRQLITMNDATALEVFGEAMGVGHVVSVRQEDMGDAAKGVQLLHQRRDELRRVDQPVPCGVSDEVAVATIRLGRIVPTVEDRLLDHEREVLHHGLHVIDAEAADGAGGTGEQSV